VFQPPVVDSFENDIALFFAKDISASKDILVAFSWSASNKDNPFRGRAFSADNRQHWAWIGYM
jgi:hypothetical protein